MTKIQVEKMDSVALRQGKEQMLEANHDTRGVRLIFVARKFANMAGGLERISIDLMNEMVNRGHSVGLMTWDSSEAASHYQMDPRIVWLKLNIGDPAIPAGFHVKIARLRKFRSFISSFKPDVILGFQSGAALFSRVATVGMKTKIIAAERVSPDMWKYVRTGFFNRITDIYALGFADRITVQVPTYIEKYPRFLRKKMVAIYNPVVPAGEMNRPPNEHGEKVLLYVARLCFQKNHRLLLDAFAQVHENFDDWKLVLIGDGDYDSLLHEQVAQLGLKQRVVFCGAVKDVDSWYRSADLVAFPSLFEGFPNALAESLSWGIPCVGLKDTLGVNSMIKEGVNGLLVDSTVEAFATGLAALMGDASRRRRMSRNAREIASMYSPQASYDLWESLIKQLTVCND